MPKTVRIPFTGDMPLIIRGSSSFFLVNRAAEKFPLLIETETDELVQGIHPGDIIAVSAPEGGELLPALYLLEMVRTYHTPVIALSKTHPAGRRLSYVVSANEKIELKSDICRGTHPEQHLLCAAGEFAGMTIFADGDCLVIENPAPGLTAERLDWRLSLSQTKVL